MNTKTNPMAKVRLEKIVVATGVGKVNKDKTRLELIADRLAKITGQKPALRGAKKSIASFKVREGDPVGLAVTLRGGRAKGFLAKLLNASFPRIRDFRGFPETVVDEMGNLTVGLREHTIFPETADEDLRDVFGLAITLVTRSAGRPSDRRPAALAFFRELGFPFKKSGEK